jgi:hypothetical protein
MKMSDYHKGQRAADDHAKFKKKEVTALPEQLAVKDIPLDEIFFVLTRSGSELFTNIISNNIQQMIREELNTQLRQVAEGIQKGLIEAGKDLIIQSIKKGPEPSTEPVEFELEPFFKDPIVKPAEPEPKPEPKLKPILKKRRGTWTNEQDEIVTDLVLEIIESGGTQLKAFSELASLLQRTPEAIGFRWNSHIRKQPEVKEKLEQAKLNRKKK